MTESRARRATRASLSSPKPTRSSSNDTNASAQTGPRRSSRRLSQPEPPGPKQRPDPLPGRRRYPTKSSAAREGEHDYDEEEANKNDASSEVKEKPEEDTRKPSPRASTRRATSRTRTMQPGGNRPPPRRSSPRRAAGKRGGGSSDSSSNSEKQSESEDQSEEEEEEEKSVEAETKMELDSEGDSNSDKVSGRSDKEDTTDKEMEEKKKESDSSSDGDQEGKKMDESEDEIDESEENKGANKRPTRKQGRSRATLTQPKPAPAPGPRTSLRRSTRTLTKESPSKKEAEDSESEDDDGSDARDTGSDGDGERPQLRQSKRARRPPAKIVEPSTSSSSEAGDPKTPVISNFSKRRSRTLGSPAQKRRRKVLTDGNRKRKPAAQRASNKRSSAATGTSRPRRKASARSRQPVQRRMEDSESDTDDYLRENKFGRYYSDGDDESLSTREGTYRDDASLLGSDNADPWCLSPASHHSRRAAESEMLHQAHYLAYPWDDLHLGTHQGLGTPALNEHLREQLREATVRTGHARGRSVPQYTAQQCLPMIQSLRVSTVLPPPKSELHSVVQPNSKDLNKVKGDGDEYMEVSVDMEEEDEASAAEGQVSEKKSSTQFFYGPKIPYASLARLYEQMCQQDVDDGREAQRQAQFLTSEGCVQRLRGLEEDVKSLQLREQRVLKTAQSVGLMPTDNVEVNRLLGCLPRDSNELSDEEYA